MPTTSREATTTRIEQEILRHLVTNEPFVRKVIPFLADDYFTNSPEKYLFTSIKDYIGKYNSLPTMESIDLDLGNSTSISETDLQSSRDILSKIVKVKEVKEEWLLTETEKFCQDKAIYNAMMEAISIMDGKDKNKSRGSIPKLLEEALAVSFDPRVGHDYLEDWEARWDFYHDDVARIPFDIEWFNLITGGGLPRKTLNIILSGPNVGKTATMCHMAGGHLNIGKNVLYITVEMAEEEISKRIDANLLNISIDEIVKLSKEQFKSRIDKLRSRSVMGKLFIKEYPTGTPNVNNFRHLLHELKIKKGFIPDVIYIDYLGLMTSTRMKKSGDGAGTYFYVKSISEEVRGLAVEQDVPIITGAQFTRGGASHSDPNMDDVAESFGLAATADWMIALVTNDELAKLSQILAKQLKSRYGDRSKNKKHIIGFDTDKMRLYTVENSAQKDIEGYEESIAKASEGLPDYVQAPTFKSRLGTSSSQDIKKKFDGFKI